MVLTLTKAGATTFLNLLFVVLVKQTLIHTVLIILQKLIFQIQAIKFQHIHQIKHFIPILQKMIPQIQIHRIDLFIKKCGAFTIIYIKQLVMELTVSLNMKLKKDKELAGVETKFVKWNNIIGKNTKNDVIIFKGFCII
jgi:hypothetical protein